MHANRKPVEVAVLGGGIGALSTALALTDGMLRGRYNVTVYQMGWRLGGKGASGRNAQYGQRIEEHGIHVWFGFYENAFRLLRGCYDALADTDWRTPDGNPVALSRCIDAQPGAGAFYPHHDYVVNEHQPSVARNAHGFLQWHLRIPPNDLVPGEGSSVPPEESLAFRKIFEMLQSITDLRRQKGEGDLPALESLPSEDEEEKRFREIVKQRMPQEDKETNAEPDVEEYLRRALDGLAAPGLDEMLAEGFQESLWSPENRFRLRLKFIAWSLRQANACLRLWHQRSPSERVRRLHFSTEIFAAASTGLSRDVFNGGSATEKLDALDEYDLRDWLKRHGADPSTLADNPVVRFVYNSAFAFEAGDPKRPSIATGSALRGILRLFFTYKGAFAYRMSSGMGDVVFSPIYALLKKRGVKFKFFHRVDRLVLGEVDGRPAIRAIDLTEQAALRDVSYDPFVWVKGFPCWPSCAGYAQLVDGARIADAVQAGRLDFENPNSTWEGERPVRLELGEHFDQVVLGIPIGALPGITEELSAHAGVGPGWKAMLEHVRTTPTQAFQLWFRGSLRDLGWDAPPAVFGTFVDPIDTYIDMTPALALEEQRADDVKNLSYFCGVLPEIPGESHARSMSRAIDNAVEHLVHRCEYIWPALRMAGRFDWSLLWHGDRGATDRERFLAGQYARANVLPSELYTLSLPGSTQYRLAPDTAREGGAQSCANLWLAGDWARNPLNLGCIEATVMAGLQAARGLSGEPIPILGEHDEFIWESLGHGSRKLSDTERLSSAAAPGVSAADSIAPAVSPKRAPGERVPWGDSLAAIRAAASTYDELQVSELCDALIQRLSNEAAPPRPERAKDVLELLRRHRYFGLLEQVADTLVHIGQDSPAVWCQYAQALIEQDRLSAALVVLERLTTDPRTTKVHQTEVLGLMGRVHKQRYVRWTEQGRKRRDLERAIESYKKGYDIAGKGSWHAANLIALLRRAERHGDPIGQQLDARSIADAAIKAVQRKPLGKIGPWDRAILAEAYLGLSRFSEAKLALRQHIGGADDEPSAFAIASMLRQLREVWEFNADDAQSGELVTLLEADLLQRQGGRLELNGRDVRTGQSNLQRLLGVEQAQTLNWYRTGLERCRLVARVVNEFDSGGGTGFLVPCGEFLPASPHANQLVLLTNEHVLSPHPGDGGTLTANQATVRFEAAAPPGGPAPVHRIAKILWSNAELDATIALLEGEPPKVEPYFFARSYPDRTARVRMCVIGHPGGRTLSLSLNDNLLIDWEEPWIHYRSPTEPGSSGSPVFDQDWKLIALHHAGSLTMRRLRGQPGVYRANEGILIEVIRSRARATGSRY